MKTYVFSDEHNCDHAYVRLADHDAALRRAKAEGVRDIAQHAFMKAELWDMAGKMEQANAIRALAIEIDARAAQIEEGEE